MVDGKTQAFADLMVHNLNLIAIVGGVVFFIMLGLLMLFAAMDLEDEPSD